MGARHAALRNPGIPEGIAVDPRSRGWLRVRERWATLPMALRLFLAWELVAVGAAAVVFLRVARLLKRPEFIFEDGQVFYLGALIDGPTSIVTPYAGYLHVAARLLAFPETWVPVVYAPLIGLLVSIAVVAFVAVYVQRLPVPLAYRLGLAAVIALLPGSRMVTGYVFEVQWYLAIVLVAAAFIHPRWWDYLLIAVLSLTGPFSILFLPLYIVVARDRRLIIVAAGAAIQLAMLVSTARFPSTGDASPLAVLEVLGYRGVAMRITGDRLALPSVPELLAGLGIVAVLVLAIIAARRDRVVAGFAFAGLATATAGALFAPVRGDELLTSLAGQRYFVMASLGLGAAALAGLTSRDRVRGVAGASIAALLMIGMYRDFRIDPYPKQGWAEIGPACIGSSAPCDVPVFPPEGWSIHWPGHE